MVELKLYCRTATSEMPSKRGHPRNLRVSFFGFGCSVSPGMFVPQGEGDK